MDNDNKPNEPIANDVISELSATIANLIRENAILRASLRLIQNDQNKKND